MTEPCKTLVVSAVNLVEGGPLTVLQDCLAAAPAALPNWRIIALVHNKSLVKAPGIELIELPYIKPSWLKRLWAEWHQFRALSQSLNADLWLSLHDMTPRVQARRQAVYCHNAAPFSNPRLRDAWMGPSYFVFALFYGLLYRPFIRRNHSVVVQQAWLREEFKRRYGVKNVVVAHPVGVAAAPIAEPDHQGKGAAAVFLYPALARCFKNFELIGEALILLEQNPAWRGRVRWTLTGQENRYAAWLKNRYGHLSTLDWIGLQTRSQMQQQYAEAHCLLFPSLLETWGLPITEAKQHGLPVLAVDLPYAHETVGTYSAAGFFDKAKPEDLAAKMLAMHLGVGTGTQAVEASALAAPYAANWNVLLKLLTIDL